MLALRPIPSCSNENFCFHVGDYSFGFNGKELDKEGMGGGASTYDYGFRIYNSALAKFLSVDPLSASYPWYTPYQFAGNSPIWAIDLDGLEQAVVVRWYINGSCTGQTIFAVTNTNDRPLGQQNFLFLNLPGTDANHDSIRELGFATSRLPANTLNNTLTNFIASNSAGSNTPGSLTDFQGNAVNIQDAQGNLTNGVAFVRGSLCASDQSTLTGMLTEINTPRSNMGRAGVISHPTLEPDIIFFADESSAYDPTLDTDNDNSPNSAEMNQALAKLLGNPDKTVTVTGHSSIEDDQGGMTNSGISNLRSNTVFNLIVQMAQSKGLNIIGRVTNGGGQGSQGADPSSQQNTDGIPSTNRKATISYDIPLQTQ